jgi:molybdopterin-guanine dinucleotide biosynthesis protein A
MFNIPAVIFAGGKSSRMGKDKALLPFASYSTLAQYQYERLQKLFTKVYISSKTNKFNFEVPLILDKYSDSSPLVGIVSIFETLDVDEVFILSVDAPFVNEKIIQTLLESPSNSSATIAKTKSGKQPLCGVYRRTILPNALKNLKQNNHRLGYLLEATNSKFIEFEDELSFSNLNHYFEYEEALSRVAF